MKRLNISLTILISIFGSMFAGCNTRMDPKDSYGQAMKKSVTSAEISGLRCTVRLVCGHDGGDLVCDSDGLIYLLWENLAPEPTAVTVFAFNGKGQMNEVRPAWLAKEKDSFYAGFGMVDFHYSFIDREGQVASEGDLGPPDSPMVFDANGNVMMVRIVRVPRLSGKYLLRVALSEGNIKTAAHSNNFSGGLHNKREFSGSVELGIPVNVMDRR